MVLKLVNFALDTVAGFDVILSTKKEKKSYRACLYQKSPLGYLQVPWLQTCQTDDIHMQETMQGKQDLLGSDFAGPRIPGSDCTP